MHLVSCDGEKGLSKTLKEEKAYFLSIPITCSCLNTSSTSLKRSVLSSAGVVQRIDIRGLWQKTEGNLCKTSR